MQTAPHTHIPTSAAPELRSDMPAGRIVGWAFMLAATLMLTIMLIYHLKPASRSLFIEYLGADRMPFAWIATALVMMAGIGYYQRMVARHSRRTITWGTSLLACVVLAGLRLALQSPGPVAVAAFIIFVDIVSVLLVEQLWSLANAVFDSASGKKWYGVIGTGGLVGGILGGAVSAALVAHTSLSTRDLLTVSILIVMAIFAMTVWMGRLGIYDGSHRTPARESGRPSGSAMPKRYFALIAAILLLAQWIAPLIDYQFLKAVEINYPNLESRTVFLSMIASLIGFVSVGINLVVTPMVHRHLGTIAGLLVHPTMILFSTAGFLLQSSAMMASATKVSDRSLAYSINRASRELLYVPMDPILTYRAKAWIDMFGYRLFKVLGSVFIILVSHFNSLHAALRGMSWMTLGLCLLWIWGIYLLRRDYQALTRDEARADGGDSDSALPAWPASLSVQPNRTGAGEAVVALKPDDPVDESLLAELCAIQGTAAHGDARCLAWRH